VSILLHRNGEHRFAFGRRRSGVSRLAPLPTLPWKKWLLWSLLVLASIITGRMAFKLYREMSQPGSEKSAKPAS